MLTKFEIIRVVSSLQVMELETAVTHRTLMMTFSRIGRKDLIQGVLTDALELDQFVAAENVSEMDFGLCFDFIHSFLDHLLNLTENQFKILELFHYLRETTVEIGRL